jgi:bifunctional non-homologous end joining protein LigD
MKNLSFECTTNGSNKEYHIQMVEKGSGFVINFQYGAIGSTLKPGTKTPDGPVDEAAAEKLFAKLIKERLAKGYTQVGEAKASSFSAEVVTEKKTHGIYPQLLNSIEEDEVMKYINDDTYIAQEKKDGERRIVISKEEKTIGLNKKGQEIQMPSCFDGCVHNACVIDGEVIGEKLFVFDLISVGKSNSVSDMRLEERLKLLNTLVFTNAVEVVKTAYTSAEKLKMYNELKEANAEGIVFKRKDSKYVAGRPASGGPHLKNKFYKEASFIVKDFTKGKRSIGLELIDENGNRVFMGKCTVPPNKDLPEIGDVVEVRYLYAYKGGAIFQPVYKHKRNDVDVEECLMNQIIYKAGQEVEVED